MACLMLLSEAHYVCFPFGNCHTEVFQEIVTRKVYRRYQWEALDAESQNNLNK